MMTRADSLSRRLVVAACCILLYMALKSVTSSFGASETSKSDSKKIVSFYLVSGTNDAFVVQRMPLAEIPLEKDPLFTSEDILRYDTDTHVFSLSDSAWRRTHDHTDTPFLHSFVVTVGDRRVYSGAFWLPVLDSVRKGIVILPVLEQTNGLQLLRQSEGPLGTDPLNDPEILAIMRDRNQRNGAKH